MNPMRNSAFAIIFSKQIRVNSALFAFIRGWFFLRVTPCLRASVVGFWLRLKQVWLWLGQAAFLILLLTATTHAQNLASFEKSTTVKKLPNGLTAVIVERPEAPVFSFYTHVDVGAAQEVIGITGLAHMFEHMAFKGTDKIGTTNYPAEKVALEKVEKAYAAYLAENLKEVGRDPQKIAALEKAWQDAIEAAQQYV